MGTENWFDSLSLHHRLKELVGSLEVEDNVLVDHTGYACDTRRSGSGCTAVQDAHRWARRMGVKVSTHHTRRHQLILERVS